MRLLHVSLFQTASAFYQSGTLHCNHGEQLYRSGGPGLGFGRRGPLGQGAPVDSVPHKPVSLVWGHTAAMLHKHLLCIIYFKGLLCVMVKSWKEKTIASDRLSWGLKSIIHRTADVLGSIKPDFSSDVTQFIELLLLLAISTTWSSREGGRATRIARGQCFLSLFLYCTGVYRPLGTLPYTETLAGHWKRQIMVFLA